VGCISNITGLAVDCSDPNGYLPDPYGSLNSVDTPGVPTSTPPPTPAPSSGGSSGSSWLGLFSGLGNLAGSISNAIKVSGSPSYGSIAATASAATPYPVTVNGQVVGYSSTPQVPTTSAGALSLTGSSGMIVLIIAVIAVFALGRTRR
jgi:hypothetical protein